MKMHPWLRDDLRDFAGYQPVPRTAGRGYTALLDANELPWPRGLCGQLNRYPAPQPQALRSRLARLYGVEPQQLLVTRGSDEAIDLLVRAFCRPGVDAVTGCPPSFAMYEVAARLHGAPWIAVARCGRRMNIDPSAIVAASRNRARLVFVCSPNNPTGGMVAATVIGRLAEALQHQALLVVDEAYIEFADRPGATALLDRHPNLVVLRTLSKAWGLAGSRIGAVLAQPGVIAALRTVQSPYPLAAPATEAALQVVSKAGEVAMLGHVREIVRLRNALRLRLACLPGVIEVMDSEANFLCVRFADAARTERRLNRAGIAVRTLQDQPGLLNALRISIGTVSEMARLVSILEKDEGRKA